MSRQTCALNNFKLRDNPQIDVSGRGFLRDDPSVWWHQTLAPENLGSNLWRKSPTQPLLQDSNSKEQAAIVGRFGVRRPAVALLQGTSTNTRLGRCRYYKATAGRRTPKFTLIDRLLQAISLPVLQSLSARLSELPRSRLQCCNALPKT